MRLTSRLKLRVCSSLYLITRITISQKMLFPILLTLAGGSCQRSARH